MRESPYGRRRARSLLLVTFSLVVAILACIPPEPADICRDWATSSSYLLEGIGLSQSRYRVLFPYIYEPEQESNCVPDGVSEVVVGGCGPRGSTVRVYRVDSLAPGPEEEALLDELRVRPDYSWRSENVPFSGNYMEVKAKAVTDDQTSGFSNRVVFYRPTSTAVSITHPRNDTILLGKSIRVKGRGTPHGARVLLFIDGKQRGDTQLSGKGEWEINSGPLNLGEHTLHAEIEVCGQRVRSREIQFQCGFRWPLDGADPTGGCEAAWHPTPAIDIVGNTKVRAMGPGTIVRQKECRGPENGRCPSDPRGEDCAYDCSCYPKEGFVGFGKTVRVRHENVLVKGEYRTYTSVYAHLDKFVGKKGDTVKTLDVIGHAGETGCANYRHLHFELWRGTKHSGARCPEKWMWP